MDENGCLSELRTVTVQVYDSLTVSLDAPELFVVVPSRN